MQRHLYFICTTDYLESVINNLFRQKHYYYTSLGNSVTFDEETIDAVKSLIKKHRIREIFFVLSKDNKIILNALEAQVFSKIKELNDLRNEIIKQKELSEVFWQTNNRLFSVISYYLNKKISELRSKLDCWSNNSIKISGKIYDKPENALKNIHSELICGEYFNLN